MVPFGECCLCNNLYLVGTWAGLKPLEAGQLLSTKIAAIEAGQLLSTKIAEVWIWEMKTEAGIKPFIESTTKPELKDFNSGCN